jgi:hypothetical protein
MMAYLAAVMAHPAFTARFNADLVRPGLRVPLTADAKLFAEAVALGSEVIWLHCYGERFADDKAGRPRGPPRLPKASAPFIPAKGAIPGAPEPLPDAMDYDPATRRLKIGNGYIELLDLLHVLGRLIGLEPRQADLLERICAGPLRKADELREAGALTHDAQKPVKQKSKSKSKA